MAQNALELYKRIKNDPELNSMALTNNVLEFNQPVRYYDNGMSNEIFNNFLPVQNAYEPQLNFENMDPRLFSFVK